MWSYEYVFLRNLFSAVPNTTVQIKCASEKYMNVHKNQKKDHLQTLQTILHRIGPFVSILARSSARTHTPLQNLLQFEQNCYGLNTQFKAKKKKFFCP